MICIDISGTSIILKQRAFQSTSLAVETQEAPSVKKKREEKRVLLSDSLLNFCRIILENLSIRMTNVSVKVSAVSEKLPKYHNLQFLWYSLVERLC